MVEHGGQGCWPCDSTVFSGWNPSMPRVGEKGIFGNLQKLFSQFGDFDPCSGSAFSQAEAANLVRYNSCLSIAMADLTAKFLTKHQAVPLMVCFSCDPSSLLVQSSSSSTLGQQPFRRSGPWTSGAVVAGGMLQVLGRPWQTSPPHWTWHACAIGAREGSLQPVSSSGEVLSLAQKGRPCAHIHHPHLLWPCHPQCFGSSPLGSAGSMLQTPSGLWLHGPCRALPSLWTLCVESVRGPRCAEFAEMGLGTFPPQWCASGPTRGIEPCRNSFALLQGHLFDFLTARVVFRQRPHNMEEARALWASLGVDAHVLELLADVHPIWDGHRLLHGFQRLTPQTLFCAVVIFIPQRVAGNT